MNDNIEIDDYTGHYTIPYEDKGIIERAYDTLECLGIYGEKNITDFFDGIGYTEQQIANFIREYNELALMNIDPIDNVEDRAHALAYFLERLTSEITIE